MLLVLKKKSKKGSGLQVKLGDTSNVVCSSCAPCPV